MQEIKCPKCGEVFQIDEAGYAEIVKQVRDREFDGELAARVRQFEREKAQALELAKAEQHTAVLEAVAGLQQQLSDQEHGYQLKIAELQSKIDRQDSENELVLEKLRSENEIAVQQIKADYNAQIKAKDEMIGYYKDLKLRQSTKMLGETLEQHCEVEFNRLRAVAFPNAYFEKDNDAKDGTKGDYIFRECDETGAEIISIMFEMKNEADETAT